VLWALQGTMLPSGSRPARPVRAAAGSEDFGRRSAGEGRKSAIKAVSVVTNRFTMELVALMFSGALNACGALILSPVLPFFAIKVAGANALDLAMISSTYSFCQMISSPLMGNLSDRVGRKPVLLAGIAASAVFFFFQAHADTVQKLLWTRAALGLAAGILPVEVAYITDLTTREQRPEVLRRQSLLIMAGAFLGPAIGAFFARDGFPTLCHIMAGVCSLNFLLGCIFFTEPRAVEVIINQTEGEQSPGRTSVISRFGTKTSGLLLFAAFMDCFALAVSDGPEAYFLKVNFNFDEPHLASFFMVCSATSLIVANCVSPVLRWLRPKVACMLFSLGSAAAVSTLFMFRDAFEPYLYAFLSSCTVTIVETVSGSALLSSMVTLDQQGTMYGIESALLNAGFSLGPPLGGALFDYDNYAPYAVSIVCFMLSAVAYAMLPAISGFDPLLSSASPGATKTLHHLTTKGPLPNKSFTMQFVAADRARQTWFVDQEMHAPFKEVQRWHRERGLQKSLSIHVPEPVREKQVSGELTPRIRGT